MPQKHAALKVVPRLTPLSHVIGHCYAGALSKALDTGVKKREVLTHKSRRARHAGVVASRLAMTYMQTAALAVALFSLADVIGLLFRTGRIELG